jgi:hypothetical protein
MRPTLDLLQLGRIPVIGILVGGIYALLTRRAESRSLGFGLQICFAVAGAVLGALVFKKLSRNGAGLAACRVAL